MKADDGIFWMPFDAFISKYSTTAINFLRPDFYYQSKRIKDMKFSLIKSKAGSFSEAFYLFAQSDHRKKGLPMNTPYELCHVISFCFKNGTVTRKLGE